LLDVDKLALWPFDAGVEPIGDEEDEDDVDDDDAIDSIMPNAEGIFVLSLSFFLLSSGFIF
jgi:hypothetical protein